MTFPVRPEHVKASGDLLADRMQTDHALYSARHFWASLLRGLPLFFDNGTLATGEFLQNTPGNCLIYSTEPVKDLVYFHKIPVHQRSPFTDDFNRSVITACQVVSAAGFAVLFQK